MAWTLEIHTIDVGRGESALIIARNVPVGGGPGGDSRAMLIDGGRTNVSPIVNDYVRTALARHSLTQLDHIVTSHYDQDHFEGTAQILNSDNTTANAQVISRAAGEAAFAASQAGCSPAQQIAAGAAAAVVATQGGYDRADHPGGQNDADQAVKAGKVAQKITPPPGTPGIDVARAGVACGLDYLENAAAMDNPPLIPSTEIAGDVAVYAGLVAGSLPLDAAGRAWEATRNVVSELADSVSPPDQFDTFGLCPKVNVIDTGDINMPGYYRLAVTTEELSFGGRTIAPVIGIDRTRTSVGPRDLGREILWCTGGNKLPKPPDGAPTATLVAANAYVWNAPPHDNPIHHGRDKNYDSIALVFRFGNFTFYTGGDLPAVGEDLIAKAVMSTGLPNGAGGKFPVPASISAFKCGHHGAKTSTSATFVDTIKPKIAFISCDKLFKHPSEETIEHLLKTKSKPRFYLTNCKFATKGVPASNEMNQLLPGIENGSRVCGDNAKENLEEGRARGNIKVTVSERAAQLGPGKDRFARVYYFDNDTLEAGAKPGSPVIGGRIEKSLF